MRPTKISENYAYTGRLIFLCRSITTISATSQDNYIRCHWHSELEISIVTEGKVLYLAGGRSFRLDTGYGLIINADTPHMMTPAGGNARFISMIVHPSFLYGTPEVCWILRSSRPYLEAPKLSALPLDPHDRKDSGLLEIFHRIDSLCSDRPFAYQLQVHGLLCTAFCWSDP